MRPRHPDRALAPGEFGATVLEHVPELTQIADIETRILDLERMKSALSALEVQCPGHAGTTAECPILAALKG